jgi:hypothetical protein
MALLFLSEGNNWKHLWGCGPYSDGGLLWERHWKWTFRFHERRGDSWWYERLSGAQDELCSAETDSAMDLKPRDTAISKNNTYISAISANQRKVQFCILLQVPIMLNGDRKIEMPLVSLSAPTVKYKNISVQSWTNSRNVSTSVPKFSENRFIKSYR